MNCLVPDRGWRNAPTGKRASRTLARGAGAGARAVGISARAELNSHPALVFVSPHSPSPQKRGR
eukprot:5259337-Lingulodinium_polyedra.AAC.1